MKKCTEFYDYCMWDKKFYGAAPFHNQLTTIDSLDDCGSFASALLEVMKDHEIPEGRMIADMVADFVSYGQQRLEDGTFYRNHSYLPVMDETMWADDMYMSIPFLCRCYESRGDEKYLYDAVKQVKNIFKYLYMPELQIMSHIYDTHYQVQTKVPWGRGNGWVLFSVSELLAVLPDGFPEKDKILSIFRKLCSGYLKLQGEEGMWHQVLTFPDSYQETSCTAMFIYGFARGVRYGWLPEKAEYAKAAAKGWEALCSMAIDWKGNIYGVCRGSGYSFSKEYYARDLGWNLNDTHGTGIVLLAGIEVEKMKEEQV
jgi:rhamnogalacturonyl hydrolase YesR